MNKKFNFYFVKKNKTIKNLIKTKDCCQNILDKSLHFKWAD